MSRRYAAPTGNNEIVVQCDINDAVLMSIKVYENTQVILNQSEIAQKVVVLNRTCIFFRSRINSLEQ